MAVGEPDISDKGSLFSPGTWNLSSRGPKSRPKGSDFGHRSRGPASGFQFLIPETDVQLPGARRVACEVSFRQTTIVKVVIFRLTYGRLLEATVLGPPVMTRNHH